MEEEIGKKIKEGLREKIKEAERELIEINARILTLEGKKKRVKENLEQLKKLLRQEESS